MTTATCACCAETTDLCESARIDGVKQPRLCKECLKRQMSSAEDIVVPALWVLQLKEAGDSQSLAGLGRLAAVRDTRKDLAATEG